jgi:hypothetical protein
VGLGDARLRFDEAASLHPAQRLTQRSLLEVEQVVRLGLEPGTVSHRWIGPQVSILSTGRPSVPLRTPGRAMAAPP